MANETLLVISGPGVAPYSARGLDQTLEPIQAAGVGDYSVNGNWVDLSAPVFRKYKSSISCTDVEAPAFDGLFPGDLVTVECIRELAYRTADGAPNRPVVTGSERAVGGYTYYRPILDMVVTGYTTSQNEYAHSTNWQLDLTEQ